MLTPKELAAQSQPIRYKPVTVAGVYLIYCSADEKGYVGSSLQIHARYCTHSHALRTNIHGNPHLQAAYNKHGSETFTYFIVEECLKPTPQELLDRENFYLLQIEKTKLFNIVIPAVLNGTSGIKLSDARRAAISERLKGNQYAAGHRHTPEYAQLVRERFEGKQQSPEQVAKRVAAKKAGDLLNPNRKLLGERNPRAKLTETDVREIRRRYAEGGVTQTQLGYDFGVSQFVIGQIIKKRLWKHLD